MRQNFTTHLQARLAFASDPVDTRAFSAKWTFLVLAVLTNVERGGRVAAPRMTRSADLPDALEI